MSKDDDFPPTQAVEPPQEPPPAPPSQGRDARSITHTENVYEGIEQLLPARTWKENPLIWIAIVVAVFMAVPFLASWATRDGAVSKPRVQGAASAPAEAVPEAATAAPERVPPAPATAAPVTVVNEPPPSVLQAVEPSRQIVTKCLENGRVVYTQTGKCAGSVSALPIDTGKNVVGPGNNAAGTSPR